MVDAGDGPDGAPVVVQFTLDHLRPVGGFVRVCAILLDDGVEGGGGLPDFVGIGGGPRVSGDAGAGDADGAAGF